MRVRGVSRVAGSRGERRVNADAVAARVDPRTGGLVVALADGIGDHASACRAALVAANAAASSPVIAGPVEALLAAQRAILGDPGCGDCVLVLAQPFAADSVAGYRIGWVGDARAYSWHAGVLRQLTTDHTVAQYFTDRGQIPSPGMDHLVTTSIRTSPPARFGTARVIGPTRLLLASDGVHKTVAATAITEILRYADDPAAALVAAAGRGDNATAVVVDITMAYTAQKTVPIAA